MKITKDLKSISATQGALALVLGISQPRISQLIKQGIVIRDDKDESGGVLIFDSIKNYYEFKAKGVVSDDTQIDIAHEKALHEAADRKMAEIRLARMEASLYAAETVKEVQNGMIANLRKHLSALPRELVPMLQGKSREEIYTIMTREIEGKLYELSEYIPKQYLTDEGAQEKS